MELNCVLSPVKTKRAIGQATHRNTQVATSYIFSTVVPRLTTSHHSLIKLIRREMSNRTMTLFKFKSRTHNASSIHSHRYRQKMVSIKCWTSLQMILLLFGQDNARGEEISILPGKPTMMTQVQIRTFYF